MAIHDSKKGRSVCKKSKRKLVYKKKKISDILNKPFSKESMEIRSRRRIFSKSMKRTRIITTDERGDLGRTFNDPNGRNSTRTMTIVLTETDNLEELYRIVIRHPKNTRVKKSENFIDELKYNGSTEVVRSNVIEDMSKLNLNIYVITLRKNDKKQKVTGKEIYREIFRELLDEYMKRTRAHSLYVLIDNISAMNDDEGVRIVKECAKRNKKRIKGCIQLNSKREPAIWPQDFITGSIGEYEENENSEYLKKVSRSIRFWRRKKE